MDAGPLRMGYICGIFSSLSCIYLKREYNGWDPSTRTCPDLVKVNPLVGTFEKNVLRAALKFAATMKIFGLDEYDLADISIHPVDSSRENMSVLHYNL